MPATEPRDPSVPSDPPPRPSGRRRRRSPTTWLVAGVVISVGALAFIGYRAVTEWQRSATLLVQGRAAAAVDLFVQALTRDMRGAQVSVLPSTQHTDADRELDLVSSAFARYPYPEVFVSARAPLTAGQTTFYARLDRSAPWLPAPTGGSRQQVSAAQAPAIAEQLLGRLRQDIAQGARDIVFDVAIGGQPYQAVFLVSYTDAYRERVTDVFGFLVNLSWVRTHYFGDLSTQVARIAGAGITLSVTDEHGGAVVGDTGAPADARETRAFPLAFFDPTVVAARQPADLAVRVWTAGAGVTGDPTLQAANEGAQRTLTVAAITSLLLAVAVFLSVRAARESAALTEMRADFVATVTHELKTPIATIRAVSESLASGRVGDVNAQREYARMAVHEAKRLTRLIDNLLAYSRVTDVTEVYSFESLSPNEIVGAALREFSTQLAEGRFEFHIDVEPDLPPVRADRTAIGLALTNLVDNAMRYAGQSRFLRLGAHRDGDRVTFAVEDRGAGIAAEDLPNVTRRFFRGKGAAAGGSGLGLAIAQRIVADHQGTLHVASTLGSGTTVSFSLPVAEPAATT
ncbi:MAG: sensor histidine kinase [Vicinamibacterales bacterium]